MFQRGKVPKGGRACPQPQICKVGYHKRGTKCVKKGSPPPVVKNFKPLKKSTRNSAVNINESLKVTQKGFPVRPFEGYVSGGKSFLEMFRNATPEEKETLAEEMGETVDQVEYLASYTDEVLSGYVDPYDTCPHSEEDECYCSDYTENLDDYEKPYTPGGLRSYQRENREKFKRYFFPNKYKMKSEAARKYYQQLLDKHFNADTATGSYFTDTQLTDLPLKGSPLDRLLFIASRQPGGLLRDDRSKYTNATQDAFSEDMYYLKVEGVQGQQRAVQKEEAVTMFGNDRKVYVVATKEGVPPDYVIRTKHTSPTYHATLVMVDEKDTATGALTGRRVVITAFPGSPTPTQKAHGQHKAGDTISLKDVPPGATVLFK